MKTIAELFEPEPDQWGHRGDVFLWREMKASFAGVPLPNSGIEFRSEFERVFADVTGIPLSIDCDIHHILRYADGDMSRSTICLQFWSTRAPSILGLRFANALGRQRLADPAWPENDR